MFGELTDDISNHEYLALRVRAGGHPRTRNAYFVNMQTDSPVSGELWQHRLYFRKNDGSWEDIFVRRVALYRYLILQIVDMSFFENRSPSLRSLSRVMVNWRQVVLPK